MRKIIQFYDGSYIYQDGDGYWSGHDESSTVEEIDSDIALSILFDKSQSIVAIKQSTKTQDDSEKLRKQLEDEKNYNRRLNMEAQRWFDIAMELMDKK